MKKLLVIGATGTVGSVVVERLTKQGHAVRGASRTPGSAAKGIEWVGFDIENKATVAAAFEGVDRAFLLSPPGHPDQLKTLAPLIEEAKRRKLEKVVLMTAMGVEVSDEIPFRKAEILLERSGLPFSIVRPNWFMQNFNSFWLEGIMKARKIIVPGGEAPVSFIDARDIGDVAARLLTNDTFENRAYTLTGPEALDHLRAAELLSRVTGQKIGYENIAPDAFRTILVQSGLNLGYADLLLTLFEALRAGYSKAVSKDVETITGSKPRTFTQYAEDYKKAWL